jgi:hypothetical protein
MVFPIAYNSSMMSWRLNFIGISKVAVSKWETEQGHPDEKMINNRGEI